MSLQTSQDPILHGKVSFANAVKQQYRFKLKVYHNFVSTLIILQIVGFLLGFFNQSYSMFNGYLDITIAMISTDQAYIFTVIICFIYGIQLTTKVAKNIMTTFVSDKLTNHIVNSLFLATISLVGAMLVVLSGVCIRLLSYLFLATEDIVYVHSMTITSVWMSGVAMFCILFLFSSFGYMIGELVQLHKAFIVIVPVLAYILQDQIASIFRFYSDIKSVALFTILMLITSCIVFSLSFVIGRKFEVRQL